MLCKEPGACLCMYMVTHEFGVQCKNAT
jgi:hypothetical protein